MHRLGATTEPWPEAEQFELALLAGQQREALSIVNDCIDAGHDLVEVEQHVIKPSLYHIGERWQANQVTVAAEHLATAIAQSVMTAGLLRSTPPATIGQANIAGLRRGQCALLSDCAWWPMHLNLPAGTCSISVRMCLPLRSFGMSRNGNADLIGLSVSFAQQLPVVKQVIGQLNERLGT